MRALLLLCLLFTQIAFAQQAPKLLKDINIKNGASTSSDPTIDAERYAPYVSSIIYKNELYFTADDSVHGRELWKTDGSTQGTVLLKDINVGPERSTDGFNFAMMTVANGKLLFVADDGVHGPSLWKTDGTTAGTVRLDDLVTEEKVGLIPLENKLLLLTTDPTDDKLSNLYFSDVTPAGTKFLGTFNNMQMAATLSDRIFFYELDYSTQTFDFWTSDGTTEGTTRIMNDVPWATDAFLSPATIERVFPFQGSYYFIVAKTESLYKTNGTAEGTEKIFTFPPGYCYGTLQEINGKVYIARLEDGPTGILWSTDGTNEGTQEIAEVYGALFDKIVSLGDAMLLYVIYGDLTTPAREKELWKSNGTPEGTNLLKYLGNYQNDFLFDVDGVIYNGQYIFESKDQEHGLELWTTDGTPEGTHLYMDVLPGAETSRVAYFTETSEGTYFTALDIDGKRQLWKLMNDCPAIQLTQDTDIGGFQLLNSTFLLSATNETNGREVFVYDTTHDGPGCMGVEGELTEAINVYPNPVASNSLHVDRDLTSWSIQDLSGRIFLKGQTLEHDGTIDISTLPTGAYIVRVKTNQGISSTKVLVK